MIKVSLIASSIRPHLYPALFKSLEGTSVEYEVVFGGPVFPPDKYLPTIKNNFKYIETKNIKPAQVYEATRRACAGETLIWVADDCTFGDDVIGKVYRFYKLNCTRKDVVCIQTHENYGKWQVCDIEQHKFFAASAKAPKMAPIGMVSREYFQEMGGIDRRYVSGQWDNDFLIRLYNDGGKLYHFSEAHIDIDHLNKHDPKYGVSGARPFGQGYAHDRKILEAAWGTRGQMKYEEFPNFTRYDNGFEPYESSDTDLLLKSESFNIEEFFDA